MGGGQISENRCKTYTGRALLCIKRTQVGVHNVSDFIIHDAAAAAAVVVAVQQHGQHL
jgi:hypothetical protein